MTLDEITSRAAALLQDAGNIRWPLAELRSYVEDSQQEWLRLTEFPRATATANVVLNNTTVAVPSSISVVKLVRLQGLQLQIVTSSQLDQKYMGQHPTTGIGGWLASTGTPLYLVKDARNANTLRIVPYPTETAHLTNMTAASNNVTSPADSTSALVFVVNSGSDTATTTDGSEIIYAADNTKYFVGASVRADNILADDSKVSANSTDTANVDLNSNIIYAADYTKYFVGASVQSGGVLDPDTKVSSVSSVQITSSDAAQNGRYAITLDKNPISSSTTAVSVTIFSIALSLINNPSVTAQHNRYAVRLDKNAIATSSGVSIAIISTNSLIQNTSTVSGYVWTIEGVANGKLTFRDSTNTANYSGTASTLLPDMYVEALVYGCLERAFLKENELRNLEKSQLWRAKFYEVVVDCQRREGQNDLSHTEGVDRMTMTIPFPTRYGGRRMYGPSWSPTTLTTSSS